MTLSNLNGGVNADCCSRVVMRILLKSDRRYVTEIGEERVLFCRRQDFFPE